ncbi:cytochrome-c peroxidase [Chloroherpeton thalassium]|nr:cytochrome-c peroxidase [Chloroherpeton thalassium]
MKTRIFLLFAFLAISAISGGCSKKTETNTAMLDSTMLKPFKPLPEMVEADSNPITEEKIKLGRMLYFETRLSKSHKFSCNSCHSLTNYGVDNQPVSTGHKEQTGDRNSPTVYNAAGHIAQFWDGRASDVEAQAKGPILNPVEMAMPDEATVVKTLKSIPGYEEIFKKAFPDEKEPITFDNIAAAIGAFERKLVTPSRWDKFLNGDETALTDMEKKGAVKFINTGCVTCHAGAYLGGQMFQKIGLVKPWHAQNDSGRYALTKKQGDAFVFKVASLRNVEKTAPYFHDGSVDSLSQAVDMMGEYQLNKKLNAEDTEEIVAFLKTLTGELPKEYIAEPELPKDGPNTPKPVLN